MSKRVLNIKLSIDSLASDQDLIDTVKQVLDTTSVHYTKLDFIFIVTSELYEVVS